MEGEEEGEYYISRTCDSQGFKLRKVAFSSECLNIFATGCNENWREAQN